MLYPIIFKSESYEDILIGAEIFNAFLKLSQMAHIFFSYIKFPDLVIQFGCKKYEDELRSLSGSKNLTHALKIGFDYLSS